MRRVGTVLALLLMAAACDDAKTEVSAPAAEGEGRVNAVMATKKAQTFADLCDVAPSKDAPKAFAFPSLLEAAPASTAPYRWVNVWATWCKPCVEEMPLLSRTFETWSKAGQSVTLTLVSTDSDAATVKTFMSEHAGTPSSLQVSDASQTSAWLTGLGLASGSAIPVHMIVNGQGQLLCARSGGISDSDLEKFHQAMFP